jgi:hypothetical protein
MPRIELQYLIRPTTTPEQSLLLENFFARFDNGGYHQRILNVEPLFFQGTIAGTEFLTYGATKLYLCYSVDLQNATAHGEVEGNVIFYNEANAVSFNAKNQNAYWEVVGAKDEFSLNPIALKNLYFSRIAISIYDSIIFNGYRITLN